MLVVLYLVIWLELILSQISILVIDLYMDKTLWSQRPLSYYITDNLWKFSMITWQPHSDTIGCYSCKHIVNPYRYSPIWYEITSYCRGRWGRRGCGKADVRPCCGGRGRRRRPRGRWWCGATPEDAVLGPGGHDLPPWLWVLTIWCCQRVLLVGWRFLVFLIHFFQLSVNLLDGAIEFA